MDNKKGDSIGAILANISAMVKGVENFFENIYGDKTIEIEKIKFILKEVI